MSITTHTIVLPHFQDHHHQSLVDPHQVVTVLLILSSHKRLISQVYSTYPPLYAYQHEASPTNNK